MDVLEGQRVNLGKRGERTNPQTKFVQGSQVPRDATDCVICLVYNSLELT